MTAVPAVLEQPDRAVRALLGLADAFTHRPLIALPGIRAVDIYANERLAAEAADE